MTIGEAGRRPGDEDQGARKRNRRWLVVLAMVLMLCVGTPVTAAVVWFGRGTIEASQGAPSPDAAADQFLLTLSAGEEAGLRAMLVDERRDELLVEWRQLRGEMGRTGSPPDKLEIGSLDVEDQGDGVARVIASVRGVWFGRNGSALSMQGSVHPWQFETRRDDGGWRVWDVEPTPWCGGHVREDACR